MHVGMADAGAAELDEHLIGAWGRNWNVMSDFDAGIGAGSGEPGGGLGGFGRTHCLKVAREDVFLAAKTYLKEAGDIVRG